MLLTVLYSISSKHLFLTLSPLCISFSAIYRLFPKSLFPQLQAPGSSNDGIQNRNCPFGLAWRTLTQSCSSQWHAPSSRSAGPTYTSDISSSSLHAPAVTGNW
ncbi:hypothetical protein B0T17DRAFT_520814 [Bombardia bombarda]|uniref:Uncharacterized protein n=1 Tax=Bombardia bombarda TaxID=252184 RepID=A0AA39XNH0_9PEZI|nr:hypothetical protein B0T17DRAFT_520814 [Bombardia bombarda]